MALCMLLRSTPWRCPRSCLRMLASCAFPTRLRISLNHLPPGISDPAFTCGCRGSAWAVTSAFFRGTLLQLERACAPEAWGHRSPLSFNVLHIYRYRSTRPRFVQLGQCHDSGAPLPSPTRIGEFRRLALRPGGTTGISRLGA